MYISKQTHKFRLLLSFLALLASLVLTGCPTTSGTPVTGPNVNVSLGIGDVVGRGTLKIKGIFQLNNVGGGSLQHTVEGTVPFQVTRGEGGKLLVNGADDNGKGKAIFEGQCKIQVTFAVHFKVTGEIDESACEMVLKVDENWENIMAIGACPQGEALAKLPPDQVSWSDIRIIPQAGKNKVTSILQGNPSMDYEWKIETLDPAEPVWCTFP